MTFIDRKPVPFRSVNRKGAPGYMPNMQRHHVLPRQLLGMSCLSPFLDTIDCHGLRFHDFRTNGLLLPANGEAVQNTRLPLHRGPHRRYNELVSERLGQIEAGWRKEMPYGRIQACHSAIMRIGLLQSALRRRLLNHPFKPFYLNSKDPFRTELNFATLDAMVEQLWGASELA